MPRACPVDFYVPRYKTKGMPRACPVDFYFPRYKILHITEGEFTKCFQHE